MLRVAPVIGNVVFVIRDPCAWRIEDRWLLHNPGGLTFEPVVKPLKVRIAWPEITFIHKVMAVGSNPQPLVADTGLDGGKGSQYAGQENIEPGCDVKSGNVDRRAKVMPCTKLIRGGMADDFVEVGLPHREVWIPSQRQAHPFG